MLENVNVICIFIEIKHILDDLQYEKSNYILSEPNKYKSYVQCKRYMAKAE